MQFIQKIKNTTKEDEAIKVVQVVDYDLFTEEEYQKLMENLGVTELDFYDEEYFDGTDFSLNKYKESLLEAGYGCN